MLWCISGYYPSICLEWLRKTMKILDHNSWCPSQTCATFAVQLILLVLWMFLTALLCLHFNSVKWTQYATVMFVFKFSWNEQDDTVVFLFMFNCTRHSMRPVCVNIQLSKYYTTALFVYWFRWRGWSILPLYFYSHWEWSQHNTPLKFVFTFSWKENKMPLPLCLHSVEVMRVCQCFVYIQMKISHFGW